jgi:hypothetical protein
MSQTYHLIVSAGIPVGFYQSREDAYHALIKYVKSGVILSRKI